MTSWRSWGAWAEKSIRQRRRRRDLQGRPLPGDLSDYFSVRRGMSVFPEWAVLEMDGQRILLSHGDTIDRKNRKYLLLRKILRSRMFYRLQRLLPVALLWRLARASSSVSKGMTISSQESLVRKMQAFAGEKFRDGFDAVVLGHCHQPLLKESVVGGRTRVFATLGDWQENRSYLSYDDGRFVLSSYRSLESRE
jgi:UDP-2,3-diacylglucosamine hydrolase